MFSKVLAVGAMIGALVIGSSVSAEPIVTVLSVTGQGTGPGGVIEPGTRLDEGTVIRTGANAQIELEFDDGTLMAVGPNSELRISEILMNGDGTAGRFAVNAVGGTFRFISGQSDKDAYEITTPTATIGIRGTGFDIHSGADQTGITLYNGAVRLCLTDTDDCWDFRGSCYVALAQPGRDRVYGVGPGDALNVLGDIFPYSQSQSGLTSRLHLFTGACRKYETDDRRGPQFPGETVSPICPSPDPTAGC